MNIDALIRRLKETRYSSYSISVDELGNPGIKEALRLRVNLVHGPDNSSLFYLVLFKGRGLFYKPWLEVYNIKAEVSLGGKVFKFVNSVLEEAILDAIAAALSPGERLFVEYLYDKETMRALEIGVPPIATRLGYMLYRRGFLWFKDWYFPEGFMEGGPKLQAEKPLDDMHKRKLASGIKKELLLFIKEWKRSKEPLIARAVERARRVLSRLSVEGA